LEIGGEVEVLEARGSEQGRDGGGLAEADFQGEVAAWGECGERGGNEAAVDVEAVGAGKESEGGFVVADFDGERVAIGRGNVGRIGEDEVEFLFAHGIE